MMKKLTRAVLLAAATFLLAGVTACEHDNGSNDPTLSKIEIKVNESTVKTTYTVGEEFNRAGITVVATYSDGSTKDVTDKATLTATHNDEAFTTKTAGTYEVTLTATYEGKSDSATCTITVETASDDPTDPTDPSEPSNPTTPTDPSNPDGGESEVDEPVTYDFTKLTSADVSALGITATEGADKDTGKIAKSDSEYELSNGAFLYSKADGNLKIRFANKNDITSAITSVNFSGQSIGDSKTDATPGNIGTTESGSVSRYIALPVSASKFSVAVTYKSTNDKKVQIVVVDESGKILAKDEPNGAKSEKTYTTDTLEKGPASKIRIYLYRIDDKGSGGADVSKIVVTPVSE